MAPKSSSKTSLDSFVKNRTLLIIAAIAMVSMIVLMVVNAVNFSPGGSGPNSNVQADLVMWGVWDDSNLMRNYISDFSALYPNVSITYRKLTIQEYEQELIDALAAGRGPDIFAMHHTWLGKHKDKMQPMPEEIMTLREYQERFLDVVHTDFIEDNQVWGFPLYTDTLSLFYNKDAFADAGITTPPETWEEFQDTVERLTKIDQFGNIDQAGVAMGTGENVVRSPDILSALMIQSGAQMNDPADPAQITFNQSARANGANTNPAQLALQFYTDFANPRKTVYTWNLAQNFSTDAFYEREAAMMLGYSYHVEQVKARSPRLNFDVAPLPQISTDQNLLGYANYWGYTTSVQSQHGAVAYEFLKYITEQENAQNYFLATKRPTARRDLVDMQSEDTEYGVFVDQTIFARSWKQPDNNAVDQIFIEAIDNVNRGLVSYQEAISNAQSEIQLIARQNRQ